MSSLDEGVSQFWGCILWRLLQDLLKWKPFVTQWSDEGCPNSKAPSNAAFFSCEMKDKTDEYFAALPTPGFLVRSW